MDGTDTEASAAGRYPARPAGPWWDNGPEPFRDREVPVTHETKAQPWVAVEGIARRRVAPDETVVRIDVSTPVVPTPQEALSQAAAARGRVRDRLDEELAGVEVSDVRITTVAEHGERKEKADGAVVTRYVVVGYTGVGAINVRAAADRAADIVNAVGGHPDAASVSPDFRVSGALRDATVAELEADAMRDARVRAERLAGVESRRVGAPLRVEAGGGAPGGGMPYAKVASLRVADAPGVDELDPEQVEITACVYVRFALEG